MRNLLLLRPSKAKDFASRPRPRTKITDKIFTQSFYITCRHTRIVRHSDRHTHTHTHTERETERERESRQVSTGSVVASGLVTVTFRSPRPALIVSTVNDRSEPTLPPSIPTSPASSSSPLIIIISCESSVANSLSVRTYCRP